MKKLLPILLVFTLISVSCTDKGKHFITDTDYRNQVHQDYLERREMACGRDSLLFAVLDDENLTLEEREALEFLFAYMPLSDLGDYDGEFYLSQVQNAFKARDFFSWGKTVPEDIFRHFVLVYRVNNENLDMARVVFFDELKDRIKDMSMYDAALEVNHWCHEKVAYRPSDSRTSAPLATIKTSYGRCGEESTFTVTAMRAVGIPARQCYTPRWAHTDDNHAWVEVWVDGKWYYLGACEPDARLDMGWFTFPATRTMMVHSNAFGKYKGEEEINHRTGLFSRINMLGNYTATKKITIHVIDSQCNPVEGASVKLGLYNYAEYYPIVTQITDANGDASATTGLGDLLVWVDKDNIYNYAKIDVRKQDRLTIQLSRQSGDEYVEIFEMVPPRGEARQSELPKEEIEKNNLRLQQEDSIRNAYMQTFPTKDRISGMRNDNLTEEQIWNYVDRSEGNYENIIRFINDNSKKKDGLYLKEYLDAISDKDLRDASAEVLQNQLVYYDKSEMDYPVDVFVKGILPPRISNEFLYSWRNYLHRELYPEFGDYTIPDIVYDWVAEHIIIDEDGNYFNCPVSPIGVYQLRRADSHSRDIFFVALCRSMNIPSYLDNATNQLFVYENGNWRTVTFDAGKLAQEMGTLVLTKSKDAQIEPVYWIHYTIARFDNGSFTSFDFEDDPRVASFPITLPLEAGYYMLSTGNRYSDGAVRSRLEFFNIAPNQTVKKEIILLPLTPRDESYGKIDMTFKPEQSKEKTVADYVAGKQLVVCFIDPNREPTRHLFKDISSLKSKFEQWGGVLLFVIPSDKRSEIFKASDWNLPSNSVFIYDEDSQWISNIVTSTNQSFSDNYPLVYIVNTGGELVFKSEGYRIGTGELIYKSLK